jgi:hypothetical protein
MRPLVRHALLGGLVLHALTGAASARAQSADAPAAPTAARLTTRDLARLRWIVGDWRGTGVDGTTQAPFYERYRFADDSTLLVESFDDSTWRAPSEVTRYELRATHLGNDGSGARWVAVGIDSLGVDFAPVARARNTFRWGRAAGSGRRPAQWHATIAWIAKGGARAQRHYRMERVR